MIIAHTQTRHAVDSDSIHANKARPQDPEDAKAVEAGEGEDKKALRFQARPFMLSPAGSSSETHQFNIFQDDLSGSKQSVSSNGVSLEASDQSIDSGSNVNTSVVISIHDAIIREQALSNIVVADTHAGNNIDILL